MAHTLSGAAMMSTSSSFSTPLPLAYVACAAELLSSIAPHHKMAVTPLVAVLTTKTRQHVTFNVYKCILFDFVVFVETMTSCTLRLA
jgi:hypothetical protein